jgi:hypothetical protein
MIQWLMGRRWAGGGALPIVGQPAGINKAARLTGRPCGSDEQIGAGEEIRTLDINLGKVALYP